MESGIYARFFANLMQKKIDLVNDTIKIVLLDNNHTFSSSNTSYSDISANEITGTGYTAGGQTLTSLSVTESAITYWDADDVTWDDADLIAYHAVIYDATASNSLICSIDFGGEQAIADGVFKIQWQSTGIITLSE